MPVNDQLIKRKLVYYINCKRKTGIIRYRNYMIIYVPKK